jgi:hypothetical protein
MDDNSRPNTVYASPGGPSFELFVALQSQDVSDRTMQLLYHVARDLATGDAINGALTLELRSAALQVTQADWGRVTMLMVGMYQILDWASTLSLRNALSCVPRTIVKTLVRSKDIKTWPSDTTDGRVELAESFISNTVTGQRVGWLKIVRDHPSSGWLTFRATQSGLSTGVVPRSWAVTRDPHTKSDRQLDSPFSGLRRMTILSKSPLALSRFGYNVSWAFEIARSLSTERGEGLSDKESI